MIAHLSSLLQLTNMTEKALKKVTGAMFFQDGVLEGLIVSGVQRMRLLEVRAAFLAQEQQQQPNGETLFFFSFFFFSKDLLLDLKILKTDSNRTQFLRRD